MARSPMNASQIRIGDDRRTAKPLDQEAKTPIVLGAELLYSNLGNATDRFDFSCNRLG
jgi:hypothetical protein